jgi:murein DD-endopeptidase MepM/ murein hydrolase activator NlpD
MPGRDEVEAIVRQVAGKYRFRDPDLLLATVHQESGFNPRAIGDSGNSRGIFQENIHGRGHGLAPEQSFDPYASTERAIKEFEATYRPGLTRGQWAAAAQRPADRTGYAQNIDRWLGSGGPASAGGGPPPTDAPPWVRDLVDRGPPATTPAQTGIAAMQGAEASDAPPWARELLMSGGSAPGAPSRTSGATAGYGGPPQTDEIWPVAGQRWGAVNNRFGAGQARASGTTVALPSSNVGADLTGAYGTPVVAPVSGTIVETFDAPDERDRNANHGWGGMTLLRGDNGYFYRLSHARPGSVATRPGQRVQQGQRLQDIGTSGNTTGPHLDAEKFAAPGQFVDIASGRGGSAPAAAGRAPSGGPLPAWVRDLMGGDR